MVFISPRKDKTLPVHTLGDPAVLGQQKPVWKLEFRGTYSFWCPPSSLPAKATAAALLPYCMLELGLMQCWDSWTVRG